jgi:hypothetical protein
VNDWEELRASVRQGPLEKRILVERSGQRLIVVFERTAAGTVGVQPTYRQETIGAWPAFRQAADLPIPIYRTLLAAVIRTDAEQVEVKGPIGLMRATESQQSGAFVMFLAMLGMIWWPSVVAIHLFDAATLGLFARTHPAALADPNRHENRCPHRLETHARPACDSRTRSTLRHANGRGSLRLSWLGPHVRERSAMSATSAPATSQLKAAPKRRVPVEPTRANQLAFASERQRLLAHSYYRPFKHLNVRSRKLHK